MSLKKNRQTNKHSSRHGDNRNAAAPTASTLVSGSFFGSLSCPPEALWPACGGAQGPGTAHSLLTLVLQECSTTLKRRGSCSKGTFTIFPGDKVGEEELAVALVEEHLPLAGLKSRGDLFE